MISRNEAIVNILFKKVDVKTLKENMYKNTINCIKNRIIEEYKEASHKSSFLKYQLQRRYIKIFKDEFRENHGRDAYSIEIEKIFDYNKFKI